MSLTRLTLALPLLLACSRAEPAEPAPSLAATVAEPAAPPPPSGPSVEDNTFRLVLAGAPQYAAGAEGAVALTLEARGGYHVNQDYPIRIDLKAPSGLKLQKSSLQKADATQFDEQRARFELPFSAESGSHDLSATVDFAVCTKETCVPDQRTVTLALQVR